MGNLMGPDFPAYLFAGTARYYAAYRVPYPRELLDDLRSRARASGSGRLLDLGCGPGRAALAMAPFFQEVWAVDWEPEMIEVGQEEAGQRGVTNVRWIVGRAENLEAPPGSFELITIGEAFHRLDQRLIAARALEWLPPGGCLATMGCESIWRGAEEWQSLVAAIVNGWTGQSVGTPIETNANGTQPGGPPHGEFLRAAGFDIESYEFFVPYVWTLESIVGNLYSTSIASKRVLGDRAEAFEADLRRALVAYDSTGRYRETLRFGYTLARRPVLAP